jgi:hypothetical protein
MTPGYVAELRRLIVVWEFAESLLDSDDPARQFYAQAIDAATSHIIEAEIEKQKCKP